MADILIAENVPDINDVLLRLLRRAGHDVRATDNGQDALDAALAQPPDLLIMNPDLPRLDGLEACRRLRAEPRTKNVPILILSVQQYPAEKEAARAAGADDYLGKPFEAAELTARVDALLDRNHRPADG
ncbi:response regulator transcription factor [Actinoplanes sp. NPDC026619]|uniref:response regulator n=1 Tax=Actinoplanes sp. NPDC026619 TaxID=3155798 RepID=UPI0033FF0724